MKGIATFSKQLRLKIACNTKINGQIITIHLPAGTIEYALY